VHLRFEVVEDPDRMALRCQGIYQVRADETRAAGNQEALSTFANRHHGQVNHGSLSPGRIWRFVGAGRKAGCFASQGGLSHRRNGRRV
jgi:hypothetical protein